jgi:integrase
VATLSITPSGTYRAQVRRLGSSPLSKSFKTRHEAEVWVRQTESELDRGIYVNRQDAEKVTFSELLQKYLNEVSCNKKGFKHERVRLLKIQRDLGHLRIIQIQSKDIAAYRDLRLNAGKSPSTVLNELSLISQIFDMSIKEWSIPIQSNPCSQIKKPKVSNQRTRRLSPDEEIALIAASNASRATLLTSLIIVAIESGMRLGELLSLTWNNLYIDKGIAYLPVTKNGESRTIPLSSKAIEALKAIPRRIESNKVFWSWTNRDSVVNVWKRTCKRAGITDLHFHDLRHEAITRLFEKGFNVMEVGCISGHKTLQMLQRYTHLRAENFLERLG